MKKFYVLSLFLLITVQSMVAERRESFLRTLCIDLKAFIHGDASEEQKERLVKHAAAMILAFSISLYVVSIFGAVRDGEKMLGLLKQLAGLARARGAGSGGQSDPTDSPASFVTPSASMRNLFEQPAPSPFSALRDDPPITPLPRLKSVKGPTGRRRPERKSFLMRKK